MKIKPISLLVHILIFNSAPVLAESITSPITITSGQEKNLVSGDTIDITGPASAGISVDGGKLNMTDVIGNINGFSQGIEAKNAGSVDIIGGEYNFTTNLLSGSNAIKIGGGSSLNIDGAKLTNNDVTKESYLINLVGSGSSVTVKNAELTSYSGSMLYSTDNSVTTMTDTNINIEGAGSGVVYSIAVQGKSQFYGERLNIVSNATFYGGSSIFLAHDKVELKDSQITSNRGQIVFMTATDSTIIDGDNLVINYISNQSDGAQGTVAAWLNKGTLNLNNSELNVSGDNAITAVFMEENTQFNANGFRLNAQDKAQAFQVKGGNASITLANSYITTDDSYAVNFIDGASGSSSDASSLTMDNSVLKANKWALRALNGGALVNVSGANSLVSGDSGAIYIDASSADSDVVFNLSDHATLLGDAYLIDKNGYNASLDLSLDQNAVWNGDLITHDNNSTGNVSLSGGSVWKGAVRSDGETSGQGSTNINIDDSYWEMTENSTVSTLSLANNGTVALGSPSGTDFHVLSVGNLSGNGEFIMRTDIAANTGDILRVTGTTSGSHTLNVINNGSANTNGTETHTIVETADGNGDFSLKNQVELGGYVYALQQNGDNWELYAPSGQNGGDPIISEGGKAPVNAINAGYLLNLAETQTLSQRMGELRGTDSEGDVWIRGFGGGFDSKTSQKLGDFNTSYGGTQMGIDKRFALGEDSLYFGAVAGLLNSDQDYATGSGSVNNYHVGLYGTYVTQSGFYIDSLVKFSDITYDFGVKDTAGQHVGAKTSANYYTASIEAGQRFHLSQQSEGLYIEPQLQLTYGYQDSTKFNESNGLQVNVDSYQSLQSRVGLNVGYDVKSGPVPLNVYAKMSYINEHDADVDFRLNNAKESESFGDQWWLAGVGISAQVNPQNAFYADIEKANSNKYENYQINAGYRFIF